MTSRFTAFPLGSGEAFLLQTEQVGKDWAVLVDSGNLSAGIPHPLVAAIDEIDSNLPRIDIAICTHHDMDHARGFRSFADAWCSAQREIGEFWLPGRWSAAIPAVLFEPLEVAQRIWNGALKVSSDFFPREGERPRRATREDGLREAAKRIKIHSAFSELGVGEGPQEFEHPDTEETERVRIDRLARSLRVNSDELQALEISIEETNRPPSATLRRIKRQSLRWFDPFWWFAPEIDQTALAISLFLEALETAKTIAAIAESAVRWRIPIRWFDFGQFEQRKNATGGIKGFLEPVSAVELRGPPPRVSDETLFLCLRLSQQNVESLVFHRLETAAEPGVMFLGDSRLSFGIDQPKQPFPMPRPLPKRQMLVTAPHHGSRVNDVAYGIIRGWLGDSKTSPIYVRNGGHHKQTITAFLDEPFRCCAQCRRCASSKLVRTVTLASRKGRWNWRTTRVPKCKY
jgi:hypothetical protein